MNNKPVAWAIKVGKDLIEIVDENRDFQELVDFYKLEQWDFEEVSLYTQEQLEEARKLGMQQERALWNLSESTQEIMNSHPVKELTDEEIADFLYAYCLDMGDVYEASEAKLIECVRAILRKAQEK